MDEPLRRLERAVQERSRCRLGRHDGAMVTATLCRLESAGIVCNAPGHVLRVGEEVRLLFDGEGRPEHFEASILRVGVVVPDRGPDGLLLGFIHPIEAGAPIEGQTLRILLPGTHVDLLTAPVRVVSLRADGLEFDVPTSFTVVFPENGRLSLAIGAAGAEPHEVQGRVALVVRGEGHLIYRVELEAVSERERHSAAIGELRRTLTLD